MCADVLSILDDKIITLRAQLNSGQEPLSSRLQEQLAAALRIREKLRPTGVAVKNTPLDAVAEWSRWERDVLAFESRP